MDAPQQQFQALSHIEIVRLAKKPDSQAAVDRGPFTL